MMHGRQHPFAKAALMPGMAYPPAHNGTHFYNRFSRVFCSRYTRTTADDDTKILLSFTDNRCVVQLTRAIRMSKTTSLHTASVFLDFMVILFGIPTTSDEKWTAD